jgi:hypothetical protein
LGIFGREPGLCLSLSAALFVHVTGTANPSR